MSMFPIASATLASDGTIQFNNLPTTFTHLQLRVNAVAPSGSTTGTYTSAIGLGDGGGYWTAGYDHMLYGDGATVTASYQTTGANLGYGYGVNGGTNIRSTFILDILDYANTNKYKTLRCLNGYDINGGGRVGLYSMLYPNLGIPTFLTFNFGGIQAGAGTTAQLYGIQSSTATGA